ncbi:MAG: SpoIID/LytB domain-containing protein, partial [Cyanobacteria bacterium K_DeepCast_35m_m2_023]|nr:SpoIID/LytB domain-containing protein [Cyanobacteria bacterium K_DeepCast_35m_m2_023]
MAEPLVRVLLFEGGALSLAAAGQPLQLSDQSGRVLGVLEPGGALLLQVDAAGGAGLRWSIEGVIRPPSPAAEGQEGVNEIWLEPTAPDARVVLQQRQYRGRLQIRRQALGLQAINHLPLELYLPSVVGSEMPSGWPQSALRAQAVAARTYALRQRKPAQPFDLRSTVSSQMYRGLESETDSTREAVAATRAQVLTYRGDLIEAVFHSSAGGSTEASGDLWAQQLPYLIPVPDYDDFSPVRSWHERFEAETLRQLFGETDGVVALTVLARSS